jgi:secreted trypsin-like serine protease
MRPRALLPLLFSLSALTACSTEIEDRSAGSATAADASKVRRVSQGIVKGTLDTAANDAVVMINIGTQGSFCTGTLIAPNLVLTAHHCVATPDETKECGGFSAPTAPAQLTVSVGLQPGNPVAIASKVFVDTAKPNNICGNDIGLFQLDRDITGVTIARVRLTKPVAGEVVTTSGYGDDGTGTVTNGRFVKTGIKVDAVGPSDYSYTTAAGQALPVSLPLGEIGTGESTCFGDSGGPLFDAAGNVIGMTSRGIDGECNDRPSIYTDTASHAAVIMAAATAAGHPLLPANALPGASTGGDTSPQSGTPGTPTSTSSGGTSSGNDTTGGTDNTTDPAPATTPTKRKVSFTPAANSGCSVAGAGAVAGAGTGGAAPRSSSLALLGLALGAALVVRRSRELRRPSS